MFFLTGKESIRISGSEWLKKTAVGMCVRALKLELAGQFCPIFEKLFRLGGPGERQLDLDCSRDSKGLG